MKIFRLIYIASISLFLHTTFVCQTNVKKVRIIKAFYGDRSWNYTKNTFDVTKKVEELISKSFEKNGELQTHYSHPKEAGWMRRLFGDPYNKIRKSLKVWYAFSNTDFSQSSVKFYMGPDLGSVEVWEDDFFAIPLTSSGLLEIIGAKLKLTAGNERAEMHTNALKKLTIGADYYFHPAEHNWMRNVFLLGEHRSRGETQQLEVRYKYKGEEFTKRFSEDGEVILP